MFKTIIIDDEIGVLKLLPHMVDWTAFDFEICGLFKSVDDALEYIAVNKIDVIFSDIYMSNSTGIDLAKICHEKYPDILIIFFSAYREFEYAQQAIKYNVFDYITKPISYNALCSTLRRASDFLNNVKGVSPETTRKFELSLNEKNITKVHNYLSNHFTESVSLNDVAGVLCMNPAYFSAYYKKQTGTNYTVTLKKIRMEHAKKFLENSEIKISAVHEMVGYNSYSHFTKTFQSFYGVTPTDYRNNFFKKQNNISK